MDDLRRTESMLPDRPIPSRLYQQGWPRRVSEPSRMSSRMRKEACRISVSQPRMLRSWSSVSVSGRWRIVDPVSTTQRPRMYFPPVVLAVRHCSSLLVGEADEGVGLLLGPGRCAPLACPFVRDLCSGYLLAVPLLTRTFDGLP